ncbi:efflux RND transporter periplasmic adaptor subunit [Pseudacidovorax intermedius]|uniref:efflux RND transporter periplasmic adaptor subunit n=1 Tax=Pseudacidovorax intermedius TaxID=433924 RepID=UPI0007348A52|nr:efflux RND transporter periplasmic adaptor subunit [Pseudacidovorax intermedius]
MAAAAATVAALRPDRAALAAAFALLAAAGAAAAPAARPLGCLIEPDRVADVGTPVVGVVDQLRVERGDEVHAGQVLLLLRADVERASASAAGARARTEADVLAARAALDFANQKLRRAKGLLQENFISQQAVDQAAAEQEQASQKLAQAQDQRRVLGEERRVADAQLAQRTVRSPFAGVVVDRFVNPGERVEEKPLMRIAVVDPLRVELMVPVALHGRLHLGDRLAVQPELPDQGPVTGTVTRMDRVFDAASNSFRVRLSLPNPGGRLPAGLRCKAELPELPPAAGAAGTPGALRPAAAVSAPPQAGGRNPATSPVPAPATTAVTTGAPAAR